MDDWQDSVECDEQNSEIEALRAIFMVRFNG